MRSCCLSPGRACLLQRSLWSSAAGKGRRESEYTAPVSALRTCMRISVRTATPIQPLAIEESSAMLIDELRSANPVPTHTSYPETKITDELARIANNEAPRDTTPLRRSALRRSALAVSVAAACAAVAIVTPQLGGDRSSAQAAELLYQASRGDVSTLPSPIPREGFAELTTISRQVNAASLAPDGEKQGDRPTRPPELRFYEGSTVRVEYRPIHGFGRSWGKQTNSSLVPLEPGSKSTLTGPADIMWSWDDSHQDGGWSHPNLDFQSRLPSDVDGLRSRIYDGIAGDDDRAWNRIEDALTSGLLTTEVRKTLYRVAATIPGVKVVGTVKVDDMQATAFSHTDSEGRRRELLLDIATGLPLGYRDVAVKDGFGVPIGGVLYQSRTTIRAVAAVPQELREGTTRQCSETVTMEMGCYQPAT